MNTGRVQILKSIYDFRKRLNIEIKWLNMMLWLKKSKRYMERLERRLANENEKQTTELLDKFFQTKFVEPEKVNIKKIGNDWKKESKSLRKKLKNIIKKSLKAKKGNFSSGMNGDGRSEWPHYDEILAKTNYIIKLELEKDRCSMIKKEDEQIDNLLKVAEEWDKTVEEARTKINELIEGYPQIKEV